MKKRLAVIGGIAGGIMALLGSTALAFILVTGTGMGNGQAYSNVQGLKVGHNGHIFGLPKLIPGQTKTVQVEISNPNEFPVKLTSVVGSFEVNGQGSCHYTLTPVSLPVLQSNLSPNPSGSMISVNIGQVSTDTESCAYKVTVTAKGELGNG